MATRAEVKARRAVRDCGFCGKRLVRPKGSAMLYCDAKCQVLKRCSNTDQEHACWVWQGPIGKRSNVGQVAGRLNGSFVSCRPERIVYLAVHGSAPPKQEVVSLCKTKCCCNPRHLGLQRRGGNVGRRPKEVRTLEEQAEKIVRRV